MRRAELLLSYEQRAKADALIAEFDDSEEALCRSIRLWVVGTGEGMLNTELIDPRIVN